VVVHEEAERAVDVVLDELGEARLATDEALRTANDVVAVGKEACGVGGGVGCDVQDVPDVFCDGERGPLEGKPKSGVFGGNGDVDFANLLALCGRVSGLEAGRQINELRLYDGFLMNEDEWRRKLWRWEALARVLNVSSSEEKSEADREIRSHEYKVGRSRACIVRSEGVGGKGNCRDICSSLPSTELPETRDRV
jgi:hypothetical protein